MTPEQWEAYKAGLTDPNQKAIAAAVESGAKVSDGTVPEVYGPVQIPNPDLYITPAECPENPTVDQMKAAGQINYDRALEVQAQVTVDKQLIDNAESYYNNVVRQELCDIIDNPNSTPEEVARANELIEHWDVRFDNATEKYETAYNMLGNDNYDGIADGDMVDITTGMSRNSWERTYERQQESIARVNTATQSLPDADTFLADFYGQFPADI